jgi:hypothetical protein
MDPAVEIFLGIRENFFTSGEGFYGTADGLDLGAGLIYANIDFAMYDVGERLFATRSGMVLVLTHECDVDQKNQRAFNDFVLVAPIIPFVEVINGFLQEHDQTYARRSAIDLVSNAVSRVFFLPPVPGHVSPDALEYGGFVFLNQITHSHISAFDEAVALCALSETGLRSFDLKLENHLRRPKEQALPRYQ